MFNISICFVVFVWVWHSWGSFCFVAIGSEPPKLIFLNYQLEYMESSKNTLFNRPGTTKALLYPNKKVQTTSQTKNPNKKNKQKTETRTPKEPKRSPFLRFWPVFFRLKVSAQGSLEHLFKPGLATWAEQRAGRKEAEVSRWEEKAAGVSWLGVGSLMFIVWVRFF